MNHYVGSINGKELLAYLGKEFRVKNGRIAKLSGKRIGDVGSGLSDLASCLRACNKDCKIDVFDPIFSNEDSYAMAYSQSIERLNNALEIRNNQISLLEKCEAGLGFLEELAEALDLSSASSNILIENSDDLSFVRDYLEPRVFRANSNLTRLSKINSLKKYKEEHSSVGVSNSYKSISKKSFDYIFANHVVSSVESPMSFLSDLENLLIKKGVIIVTDYKGTEIHRTLSSMPQSKQIRKLGDADYSSIFRLSKGFGQKITDAKMVEIRNTFLGKE